LCTSLAVTKYKIKKLKQKAVHYWGGLIIRHIYREQLVRLMTIK